MVVDYFQRCHPIEGYPDQQQFYTSFQSLLVVGKILQQCFPVACWRILYNVYSLRLQVKNLTTKQRISTEQVALYGFTAVEIRQRLNIHRIYADIWWKVLKLSICILTFNYPPTTGVTVLFAVNLIPPSAVCGNAPFRLELRPGKYKVSPGVEQW